MRLNFGGTYARCRSCEGEDFIPAYPLPASRRDVLICARCGHEMIYSDIAREMLNPAPSTPPLSQ